MQDNNTVYYNVAVEAPLPPLTYCLEDTTLLPEGCPVTVPLGRRKVKGVVLGQAEKPKDSDIKIKSITTYDAHIKLPKAYIKWMEWLSRYYIYPVGQIYQYTFPKLKKKTNRKTKKTDVVPTLESTTAPKLTPEQQQSVNTLANSKGFSTHLIFGVTGSGKTEVYMNSIEKVMAQGKKALVLVPEISLTPQLIERFSSRFPNQVAVIHSSLTPREKTNQWWHVIDNEKQILIGARSALFCPIENLGLIVVDEEHESSFKQDEKLKYNARDAAVMLGLFHNCPVALGSATPSLESWKNVLEGKYQLHKLTTRVSGRAMPEFEIIDMRQEREARKDTKVDLPFWLSKSLYEKIKMTLEKKEQVALFLNRRGMAQTVLCQSCGYVFECPNCSISLTLHAKNHLVCHYCDYHLHLSDNCPKCADPDIHSLGLGTELVENDIHKLFPEARLARADRDEIQSREQLEVLIKNIENREIDILIGTQMIAKGLDFPGLTLVGLVMADVALNMPDFRTAERSFQLFTQVAGRSGRHSEDPGQVVLQTYNPTHSSIQFAITHNFDDFATHELEFRKQLAYPPYGRLASLRLQGNDHSRVEHSAHKTQKRATILKERHPQYSEVKILGPTASAIAKLRGKFRYHILLKAKDPKVLENFCTQLVGDEKWLPSGTRLLVDIDPYSML